MYRHHFSARCSVLFQQRSELWMENLCQMLSKICKMGIESNLALVYLFWPFWRTFYEWYGDLDFNVTRAFLDNSKNSRILPFRWVLNLFFPRVLVFDFENVLILRFCFDLSESDSMNCINIVFYVHRTCNLQALWFWLTLFLLRSASRSWADVIKTKTEKFKIRSEVSGVK